jgi:hypothetical protein
MAQNGEALAEEIFRHGIFELTFSLGAKEIAVKVKVEKVGSRFRGKVFCLTGPTGSSFCRVRSYI